MTVTSLRIFAMKKPSRHESALVERALSDVARHLSNAAECLAYPSHCKYHFKLAYDASAKCPVEYVLTEQARHVIDGDTFGCFMEYVLETANAFRVMTRADRKLLTNLLTDAINLAFRWLTPCKSNRELIIHLHVIRANNANVLPFNQAEVA